MFTVFEQKEQEVIESFGRKANKKQTICFVKTHGLLG